MELKGSRTEANLMAAFAGESKQEISILIMLQKLKRMDMNKLQRFLKKLPIMKKNMQRCGLKNYMVEVYQVQKKIY